jgi:hypothetical protein
VERLAELQRWHAVLHERESWLVRDRQRWELERERSAERLQAQRKSLAEHWRTRRQSLHIQQKALADRRADLAQRQAAVEQQQAELSRQKRELLEQQVSLQLLQSGVKLCLTPALRAALRQSLRAYVDEQLAAQQASFLARERELHHLAHSLQEQQAALVGRQKSWRLSDLERQQEWSVREAELVDRQRELDDRSRQLDGVARDLRTWIDSGCDEALTKKASDM